MELVATKAAKISIDQAFDNLRFAIVARAMTDALQADSLCSARDAKDAKRWLNGSTADWYTDGASKQFAAQLETGSEFFRQKSREALKEYWKNHI